MSSKKNKNGMTRQQEAAAAKFFGKHVTNEKAAISFAAAFMLSMLPMLIGIRYWNEIPKVVETGIVSITGEDDSMPRWALVYMLPGVFTVLTAICHGQLWLHQKANRLPPISIRLLGRWVMPIISLFFCSWAEISGAGHSLDRNMIFILVLGAVLVYAGANVFDSRKGALLSLDLPFTRGNESLRAETNRTAGVAWVLAGFAALIPPMSSGATPLWTPILVIVLIIAPFGIGFIRSRK